MESGIWELKAKICDIVFNIPPFKNIKNEEKNIFFGLLSQRAVTGAKILDIGCGTGDFTQFFIKNNLVLGVDIAANMLAKARQKITEGNFVRADAAYLPFKDSTIDFVSMVGLLEYFKDQSKPVFEVSRVLRDGGTAIVSFSKPSILNTPRLVWGVKFFTTDDAGIVDLLTLSNLKILRKKMGRIQTQVLCEKNL